MPRKRGTRTWCYWFPFLLTLNLARLTLAVRHSTMFRPANVSAKGYDLLYAGSSTTPGIGMPMCLISAELAAKRLLGATDVGPLPTPAPHGFLARSRRTDVLGDISRLVRTKPSTVTEPAAASSTSPADEPPKLTS